jgi:hypothetical protein
MDELQAATQAIYEAEAALASKPNPAAQALVDKARGLVAALPVSETEASDPAFAAVFTKKRKKATDEVPQRQAEVEQQWDSFARANYAEAEELAKQAAALVK